MKIRNLITCLPVFLCLFAAGYAQVDMSALNVPLTQNFDTLANTGTNITWTNNSTIPGWYSSRAAYNSGTGASNTGALYSFGTASATDRALGGIASGGTATFYWGVRLHNSTGSTITSLNISFTGEQWRDGGNTTPVAQTMPFEYQVSQTPFADITSGTYVADTAFNFTSPVFTATAGALDGNAAENRVAISAVLNVVLNPGDEIMLRWTDNNDTGNDHGLGIDDVSITPAGGSLAPATIGGRVTNATGFPIRGAVVTLTGKELETPRVILTNSFGYFRFNDMPAGSYTVTVANKRYTFKQSSQNVNLTTDILDVNFASIE